MQVFKYTITAATLVVSVLCLAGCATSGAASGDPTTPATSTAGPSSFDTVVNGIKSFLVPTNGSAMPQWPNAAASAPAGASSGVSIASGAPRGPHGEVGVPTGSPGTSTPEWPANEGCRIMPSYSSALDVDTVYAHAMRAYSFRSIEQEQMRSQLDRLQWTETNYLHERQPGSYYHLRQSIGFRLAPVDRHSVWLELELTKNGTGSDVSVKYCYITRDTSSGTVAFHTGLQQRFRAELG